MLRIRRFEERVAELYRDGLVPGFVHLSVGQEATAVGATWPLRPDDYITSTHRGHGHVLAKGLDVTEAFAELMARDTGACRGRGGSMHLADPHLGILGANGIVAGGLPIAAGAGLAARLGEEGRVVVAFFGDGAVAQGAFHEAANLAAVWGLPVVFCCENNHYAEFSLVDHQHPVSFAERAAGYGMPYHHAAGNDVEDVAAVFAGVIDKVRAGGGPIFVESETHRRRGHYEGDPQKYRKASLDTEWDERDPIGVARRKVVAAGAAEDAVTAIEREVEDEIALAEQRALAAPAPDDTTLFHFVSAPRVAIEEPPLP